MLYIAPKNLSLKIISCYQLIQAYKSTGHLAVPFMGNIVWGRYTEENELPPVLPCVSPIWNKHTLKHVAQAWAGDVFHGRAQGSQMFSTIIGLGWLEYEHIPSIYMHRLLSYVPQTVWRLLPLSLGGVVGDYGVVWEHWLEILCLARVCTHCHMPECSQTGWFVLAGDRHLSCLCSILGDLHHCSLLALLRTRCKKKSQQKSVCGGNPAEVGFVFFNYYYLILLFNNYLISFSCSSTHGEGTTSTSIIWIAWHFDSERMKAFRNSPIKIVLVITKYIY